MKALRRPEGVNPITLVVDDATGLTPSMVPWLVAFAEAATLVLAVHPETLRKAGTKRLWMRLDRVDLPPLSPKETRELARALVGAATPAEVLAAAERLSQARLALYRANLALALALEDLTRAVDLPLNALRGLLRPLEGEGGTPGTPRPPKGP